MEKIEICKVDSTDMLERCLEIRANVFTFEKGVPKEIEVDQHDRPDQSCDHFLVRYGNRDVGALRCPHTTTETIRLQRFCFLKEYRGLGLGKNVMAYLEDFYKSRGFKRIEMDAKYAVSGFYEKCGYEKVSDVFIEADVEHIKMRKHL